VSLAEYSGLAEYSDEGIGVVITSQARDLLLRVDQKADSSRQRLARVMTTQETFSTNE